MKRLYYFINLLGYADKIYQTETDLLSYFEQQKKNSGQTHQWQLTFFNTFILLKLFELLVKKSYSNKIVL